MNNSRNRKQDSIEDKWYNLPLFSLMMLFYFSISTPLFASPINVDSLLSVLNLEGDEKAHIEARNKLAYHYFSLNVKKSIEYVDANLQSSLIQDLPDHLHKTYYLKGRAHLLMSELSSAEEFLKLAQPYFFEKEMHIDNGNCLKDLGTIAARRTDLVGAEFYISEAKEEYEKANYPIGVAHCILNMGSVYSDKSMFTKAINFYYDALERYDKLKLYRYQGLASNNIGNIYSDFGNHTKASEAYSKSIGYFTLDNDSLQIANVTLNQGSSLIDLGNYKEAFGVLNRALELSKKTGFNYPLPMIYGSLAECKIVEKDYDAAMDYLLLCRSWSEKVENKIEESRSYLKEGLLLFKKEQYDKAIAAIKKGYRIAEKYEIILILESSAALLHKSYKAKGDAVTSLKYLELEKVWNDSLAIEYHEKNSLAKDFEYQLKEQKKVLELAQEKDREVYESRIKFQNILLFVFLVAFFLLGLTAFAFFRNLRAKQKVEIELEEKNQVLQQYIESNIKLEQFAHIASHDLKSPLRTVGSFSSLLRRKASDKLDEKELGYLDFVEKAAKLMSNLVDDLMTYSKVNSLQMNIVNTSVSSLIQDVLSNLNFSIQEKNAEISIADMPANLEVDEVKLRQVFQNLIANALKFVPEGRKPIIEIDCKQEGANYKFSVSDNGIGIGEEFMDKIFVPFKQLHAQNKFEGTGMGLAICKRIIEKHGGEISVESVIGEGTTFIFTIPVSAKVETNNETDFSEAN